eukprot:5411203-Prymnesium_polylepis.1
MTVACPQLARADAEAPQSGDVATCVADTVRVTPSTSSLDAHHAEMYCDVAYSPNNESAVLPERSGE